MLSANAVMAEPIIDRTCPDQTSRKARNPSGLCHLREITSFSPSFSPRSYCQPPLHPSCTFSIAGHRTLITLGAPLQQAEAARSLSLCLVSHCLSVSYTHLTLPTI